MSSKVNDDASGPSVDSENQEERILARRNRIQRRQEALKRAQTGEDEEDQKVVELVKTVSQRQMEESYILLRKLHEDGFEMVTNIRIASDAREVTRRIEEEEARRHRKEKLEAEAKAGAERFEEITKKWEYASQKEIPQDLHDMLNQQTSACDAMLDEKNKLITDYQAELKAKDDQYVRDLKKQAEDIDLLIERMENQVKELTKSYQTELEQIEKAFVLERNEMLEQQNKSWNQMLLERRKKEIEYLEIREKRVEECEQQLQILRIQDAEEYNQVKIKLETDVQILQQQLQQMKATYQLNQEKLEYNFQVLRKRDEENTITKSQQKRKITRLHDVLTNQKQKLAKQEKMYKGDNQQLTADYRHQLDQFKDVQRKAKTFMGADAKKFNDIWLMNEEECKQLVKKVLEADRVIHEQQLGLPWSPPADLSFLNNVGPVVSQNEARRKGSAKRLAQQVLNKSGERPSEQEEQDQIDRLIASSQSLSSETSNEQELNKTDIETTAGVDPASHTDTSLKTAISQFSPDLIKQILELLCDESGFLIESKLLTLLAPLQPCEQTLMKLDAIFSAMGIDSEEDIKTLSRYFVKFRVTDESAAIPSERQENNNNNDGDGDINGSRSASSVDQLKTPSASFATSSSAAEHVPAAASNIDGTVTSRDTADVQSSNDVVSQYPPCSLVSSQHRRPSSVEQSETSAVDGDQLSSELVHPNDVLKALRAFVEETNKHRSLDKSQMTSQFTIVNINERDSSEDAAYWNKYSSIFSNETEKVWDALLSSFEKYYGVLTSRSKLIEETDAIRQQNGELRLLLHQYVNSKVNQELHIPPTSLYQFNRIM